MGSKGGLDMAIDVALVGGQSGGLLGPASLLKINVAQLGERHVFPGQG